VFFIRHGESKWNEATAEYNIKTMLAFDHPLNDKGIAQVRARP
jgi:broad specificity phosphatase PhoE